MTKLTDKEIDRMLHAPARRRRRSNGPRNAIGYDRARSDFEYLEKTWGELDDAVEIDGSVFALMRNPTKPEAAKLYAMGVRLWLGQHRRRIDEDARTIDGIVDPRIVAIMMRYR